LRHAHLLVGGLALSVFAAGAVSAVTGAGSRRPTSRSDQSTDRLVVRVGGGGVSGRLTPNAQITVELSSRGVVRASRTVRADPAGQYSAQVGYDAGHGSGLHDGDDVIVSDASDGERFTQPVDLWAYFDEQTGRLVGRAAPRASVAVRIFSSGKRSRLVASSGATATSRGDFSFDTPQFGAAAGTATPPWRGYLADLVIRTHPGQSLLLERQTPNLTVVQGRSLAGGSHLLPGTKVDFTIDTPRGGHGTTTAVVDGDGVAQGKLPSQVPTGAVVAMAYRGLGGAHRTLTLEPWLFSVVVLANNAVSGTGAPSATVAVLRHAAAGVHIVQRDISGDGTFRIAVPPMLGGEFLVVWRVADPDRTGVGIEQVELHVPTVQADVGTSKVSGYGPATAGTVRILVRHRNAATVTTSVRSDAGGHFSAQVPTELVAGDVIEVVAAGQRLSTLGLTREFTARSDAAPTASRWSGTGEPGWHVGITAGNCSANGLVAAEGTWRVETPCRVARGQQVLAVQQEISGAQAGYLVGRRFTHGAPSVRLLFPLPGTVVPRVLTAKVELLDVPGAPTRATVALWLDGRLVISRSSPPWDFAVTLTPGPHRIAAVATEPSPGGGPLPAAVVGWSAIRYITSA
jgi:hypothetical protein